MDCLVTYDHYKEFGGKAEEEDYKSSLRAAKSAVDDIVGFNQPLDEEDEQAYERAIYAAIDVDYAYGASGGIGENLSSVRLGIFSASMGGSSNKSSYDADMSRAIRRELHGSSLLYQGLA